jgi:pantetheine-phosphate adenylyltransferase
MARGVYAGSFDPFTFGHWSIVTGALKVCDRVIIGVGVNSAKKGLFTTEERVQVINEYVSHFKLDDYVDVREFEGLLTTFCQRRNYPMIIRGLRAVSDFEYEMAVADANRRLAPELQTVFIPTEPQMAFVSSSIVKEVARHVKDPAKLESYVLPSVAQMLLNKLGS